MGLAGQLAKAGGLKSAQQIARELAAAVQNPIEKRSKEGPSKRGARARSIEAAPAPIRTTKTRGRPRTGVTKQQISIRLDADIVAFFQAKGDGWRSAINDALRLAMKN
ncbi:BrnA antitoxin family protein [Shinella zoogloeoides]|uniref:BrnA antitoxin family protein n=1 Tax=Shinella zoogloeoides TaxID=352475 RepID=UPI00299DB8F3|nr:BrnA antitoxin family protein [Shinella zoogloeoides]